MRIILILVSLFFSCMCLADAPQIISPVGYWKTIDDVTGKPKSIIKISEDQDHRLQGTVIKIFSVNKKNPHELCLSCEGDKHNQPIIGMTILTNLKLDEDQWTHGKILDPANGKTYKCNVHTFANGKKLNVRGFIGLPILGRTQTWVRVSDRALA